ncbi:NUDIX hydrolase [Caulobacter segnis]|uniref:NUDIX hydrolase n=1 Tax=Caulobacter segnis TaxID=88688 RepID=UPI00241076E1|nr:NUDIX hydrolase [Caulobacter segnis]MDG2522244.1 NUDIX hydrolase [Caulobacter segnis]
MAEPTLDAEYDPLTHGALRKAGAAAVATRHAATLIVVRRDGPSPRVLMGRRNGGHAFMPGKWVFPGGRVDRTDFTAPSATDLPAEVLGQLSDAPRHKSITLPRALGMAAIRETFEEAGLLLAKPIPPRPGAGPWRDFLAAGAAPDLSALTYVARAITPPYRPRRFDARFFMAEADRLISLERRPGDGELDEIGWLSLDEALTLEELPAITRFVVQEVAERLKQPGRPIPYMRFLNGRRKLVYL